MIVSDSMNVNLGRSSTRSSNIVPIDMLVKRLGVEPLTIHDGEEVRRCGGAYFHGERSQSKKRSIDKAAPQPIIVMLPNRHTDYEVGCGAF